MEELTKTLRHYFTPHHTNNHRPRILHPEMLLAIIALLFVVNISMRVTARTYPGILGFATNITVDDLLLYTNQERLNKGLNSLQLNPVLSMAAEQKAHDMFEDNYWAHIAPDGRTPWDFIVSEGYAYTYAGENLARDFADSKGVVTAWMNSPSHRDNVLRSQYEEIGFAIVNGKLEGNETTLVVQMFGTPRQHKPEISSSFISVSASESAEVAAVLPSPAIISPVQSARTQHYPSAWSVQKPVLDEASLQRFITLFVLGGLLLVFVIDGVYIWRRRTFRIAGHNIAHILFIISIIGIIVISNRGSVLSLTQ
jgi:hypothetical protein